MLDNLPESDRLDGCPHPRETPILFGHNKAQADFLKTANNKKLHHAWLLSGPKGIGKATLAWKIARYILALDYDKTKDEKSNSPKTFEINNDNPIFKKTLALTEPKLQLLRRTWDQKTEKFKQSITIDEVRAIKQFLHLSSTDGGQRVVIIDSADDLQISGANALLKILEEPPIKTTILLISHNPTTLLQTIKSRCRKLNLKPLISEDLEKGLIQAIGSNNEITNSVYELSEGSIGNAYSLLNNEGFEIYEDICSLFLTAPDMDRSKILKISSKAIRKNSDFYFDTLISMLSRFVRRLALTGANELPKIEISQNEFQILNRLSPNLTAAKLWSETSQGILKNARAAKHVNLESSSIILDIFLKFNNIARKIDQQ